LDILAPSIGQSESSVLKSTGQLRVIKSQLGPHGGVQIVNGDRVACPFKDGKDWFGELRQGMIEGDES
jgi:hypothetical protein